MASLTLSKNKYSESVVRKALYWCSEYGAWALEDDEEHWNIKYDENNAAFIEQLNRHLNDFLLREELERQTGGVRRQIIDSALKAVLKHVQ